LVKLPAELSFQDAAAIFDHGLTAHYLSTSTFPLRKGHRVLIQAAAGGVGCLLTQFAKRFGATVYGTARRCTAIATAVATTNSKMKIVSVSITDGTSSHHSIWQSQPIGSQFQF